MKQLSKNQIRKLQKYVLDKIANIQILALADILKIRATVNNFLEKNIINEKNLNKLINELRLSYKNIFYGLENNIKDAYNEIYKNQRDAYLSLAVGAIAYLNTTFNSNFFNVTNNLFSSRSIDVRSRYLSKQVIDVIQNGIDNNLNVQQVQKQLDIVYGYRNKNGTITPKSKALIGSGKFTHTNGNIYETYRIARTETMRAAAAATYKIYDSLEGETKRLQLHSVIDGRTREQSAMMNGQISNKEGEFRYPDGNYYRLGAAPAKWSINDRETASIVFLDNQEVQEAFKTQEKISSIDISLQNNILPRLNDDILNEINSVNKNVLVKKNIVKRNNLAHSEAVSSTNDILSALYRNTKILQDSKKTNYYHFIRNIDNTNYVVLLDTTNSKDYFEVVHYLKMNNRNVERLIQKHTI